MSRAQGTAVMRLSLCCDLAHPMMSRGLAESEVVHTLQGAVPRSLMFQNCNIGLSSILSS